ncbi:hypothetical protein GCM10027085_37300 [Spirosoma aerophilum]
MTAPGRGHIQSSYLSTGNLYAYGRSGLSNADIGGKATKAWISDTVNKSDAILTELPSGCHLFMNLVS